MFETSVYRHSSVSADGIGRAPNSSKALLRSSATNRLGAGGRLARASSSNEVAVAVLISADRALHLKLDQPVELYGVLHRKLSRDRFDEAVHDHGGRLDLGEPAAY